MKKRFVIVLAVLVGVIVLSGTAYIGIHSYANGKIINQYTKGFEKNHLGDRVKNISLEGADVILSVYDASLFNHYTNLSAHDQNSKSALIIWIPIYGGDIEYGIVITDDENQISYQIEVNEQLEADNEEDNQLLEEKKDAINRLREAVNLEWNMAL